MRVVNAHERKPERRPHSSTAHVFYGLPVFNPSVRASYRIPDISSTENTLSVETEEGRTITASKAKRNAVSELRTRREAPPTTLNTPQRSPDKRLTNKRHSNQHYRTLTRFSNQAKTGEEGLPLSRQKHHDWVSA